MRLLADNVPNFMKVVEECTGTVYLTSNEVDKCGNYLVQLNLKSTMSLTLGLSKLLSENGDIFEIHTSNRDDETRIIQFLQTLDSKTPVRMDPRFFV